MSKPDHVADRVDALVHGLLPAEDAARVERHCRDCPDCQSALDAARKRLAALRAVPATEAPPHLVPRTIKKIDEHGLKWRRVRNVAAGIACGLAACFALLLLGAHIHFHNLKASPYDLRVFGQTKLQSGTPASLRVRLADRSTNKALAGVPVQVALRDKLTQQLETLCSFTTNDDGTGEPRFTVPEREGDYDLVVTATPAGVTETVRQPVSLRRDWKLMLTSDKPVYQPGQTLLMRSLTLGRFDQKPAADRDAVFTVTDPKGNVIFKQTTKTSGFGIASSQCALDPEVMEGPYAVQCLVGGTSSKLTVEVKKYVLPKFKVTIDLDQPYYKPDQPVLGTVKAQYFHGKPVANGEVKLQVLGEKDGQFSVEKMTNADGEATFVLPHGKQSDRAMIAATVTDGGGQKETRVTSFPVTDQDVKIDVIPEMGRLVPGVENTVFILTTYPDGRPAKTTVTVSGLGQPLRTNSLGVAHVELPNAGSFVNWTVRAEDEQGRAGTQNVQLSGNGVGSDFLLRTDKAVYSGGETLKLTAFGGGVEPVFFDLIKDGQTVLTETLRMSGGAGEYQLDLPPELTGTVQLCAYRFGSDGVPLRKTRVLFVKPSKQLDVRVTPDQTVYRPRGQAELKMQLLDGQGRPTPGALSLVAVDEAVYSVQEQRPGLEKVFYALEQELLKPVYAIYPWTPDLDNAAPPPEREEFERALFATTAQTFDEPQQMPTRWGLVMPEMVESEGRSAATAPQPHTLSASTFTTKTQDAETTRDTWMPWVRTGWMLLIGLVFGGGVLVAYVALWMYAPKMVVFAVHLVGGLVAMLLVASVLFLEVVGVKSEATFEMVGAAVAGEGGGPGRNWFATPAPAMDVATGRQDELSEHFAPGQQQNGAPLRLRDWFPETLRWEPQLITDDQGRYTLPVELADSITDWRVTVSGVTGDGRLGSTTQPVKVFQPFFVDLNLPVALTRNDEAAVPVVVQNWLDKPQTVSLTLEDGSWFVDWFGPWFDLTGDATRTLELKAHEVKSLSFRLKVKDVGRHTLKVTARAAGVGDAVRREIDVVPDGRRVDQVVNGTLDQPANLAVTVPADAIPGSAKAILKLYPSNFSQVVEGLDGIFRMPSGCFEQTSSTTYPNVLALDYLDRTGKSVPEVRAKAKQYVHLGYQRLLGFEVMGGGFDWFGRPPANRTLTAYGLMEFQDMAKVHDVDPELIRRTRAWLLRQRNGDGSWEAEGHGLHEDPTRRGKDGGKLTTTAYIAWAVFDGEADDSQRTRDYLLLHPASGIDDPYTLALMANALQAMGAEASPYLERLVSLRKESDDGKLVWWEQSPDDRTMFYGAGRGGSVETTAMAALALMRAKTGAGVSGRSLAWLVKQKDANGTWYSTQATVLALKALLAGTDSAKEGETERRVIISWNGGKREVVIPPDQAEVMQLINLSSGLTPGKNDLTIREANNAPIGYQLSFRHHVPGEAVAAQEPLAIDISYDRTELTEGESITATAKVVNRMAGAAPMVMLDLPIPGGFSIAADDLRKLVDEKQIARFQINPRSAIVYLRGLEPGKPLTLKYRLVATMPVKVTTPAGRVYEYYDADKKGESKPVTLTVSAR